MGESVSRKALIISKAVNKSSPKALMFKWDNLK